MGFSWFQGLQSFGQSSINEDVTSRPIAITTPVPFPFTQEVEENNMFDGKGAIGSVAIRPFLTSSASPVRAALIEHEHRQYQNINNMVKLKSNYQNSEHHIVTAQAFINSKAHS